MTPDRARRVVVIDPAFVGDTVFDAVLIRELRRRDPGAHLGLVVRPPSHLVAQRVFGLDRVHVFDKRGADRGLAGLRRVAEELRSERYEEALIPHPSIRSVLLARLADIRERTGIATAPARWLLTRPIDARGLGLVDRRLALLRAPAASSAIAGALEKRSSDRDGPPRIGLVIGSAWATKRWPMAHAAELIGSLSGFTIVLLGGPSDRALLDELRAIAPRDVERVIDAVGGTIEELTSQIEACDVVVAGDTGPLHIARALGVPVVALFGPTPVEAHVFAATDAVLTVDLACRPCHPHGPAKCPEGHHRCMRDLSAGRVRGAIERVLEERDPGLT
jgi:heptosyltransferase II